MPKKSGNSNYIYLKNNNNIDEKWRIIGLFLNETKTKWNVKLVRDELLPEDYFPDNYTINKAQTNGTLNKVTFTIKSLEADSGYKAYWNKNDSGTELNRWEEAGLQYYLNTEHDDSSEPINGYLSYLSKETKNLLTETTYYFGAVTPGTPKSAYNFERKVDDCDDGHGAISKSSDFKDTTTCRVWKGNASTWKGKVALMYPSDYGLSTTEDNWAYYFQAQYGTTFKTSSVNGSTWMYKTMIEAKNKQSWFLSPLTWGNNYTVFWDTTGEVINDYVYNNHGVRPVVYLLANTQRLDGDGTSGSPYIILN